MAAEYGVERKRSAPLSEEALCARLADDASAQPHRREVVRGEEGGPALRTEEGGPKALGTIFEQGGEDVVWAHQGHGTASEVANVVRDWERGELSDGIADADGCRSHEDAAFEASGQLRCDAVGADGCHYSARAEEPPFALAVEPAPNGKTSSRVCGYRLGSPG